ncbi:uncharacterized protein LOC112646054 isoform X3 [Canis lupus dingo]|uniref:uncharacterized protein LOC112646054 isoform X3 n=1 Tax=Canis lupus dingo TaxID=286419 RepID=UPI0020C2DD51|nr:uncharacterized protein LOC112646054 isoform X3 [Canis lupus dingo]
MRISTSRWWRRTGSVASPNALRAWTAPLTVTRTDALCRGGSRLRLLLHGHALVLGAALRGGRRPASAGGGPGGVAAVLLLLLLLLVSLSVFVARSRRGGQGEGGSGPGRTTGNGSRSGMKTLWERFQTWTRRTTEQSRMNTSRRP